MVLACVAWSASRRGSCLDIAAAGRRWPLVGSVWDHSTFSKNRDRLLNGAVAARFLSMLVAQLKVKRLLSTDHLSADGTLIKAWTSMSFRQVERFDEPEPGDPPPPTSGRNIETTFRGETRSNATHSSTTDPDAKLCREGPFGWMKSIGGMRRMMLRGTDRVGWAFTLAAAYNLVRLPSLMATAK